MRTESVATRTLTHDVTNDSELSSFPIYFTVSSDCAVYIIHYEFTEFGRQPFEVLNGFFAISRPTISRSLSIPSFV